MLHLFDVTITFSRSRDFLKCVTFAHIAASTLLLQSNIPLFISIVGIILLIFSYLHTRHIHSPQPDFISLKRQSGFWIMTDYQGKETKYDNAQIQFDGGLFFLLRLTNNEQKKTLVLFHDQITQDQHRRLQILSRIT